MPYCIHCGTELGEQDKFCHMCGEKTDSGDSKVDSDAYESVSILLGKSYHDKKEQREPSDFELLKKVMHLARDKPEECLNMCIKQTKETPDYDMPHLWLANFQDSNGNRTESIQTLKNGLHSCLRVSNLLQKLGERYLDSKNPLLATIYFGKAILAQEPPRSEYQAYLYFSYVCQLCEYENAYESALQIARDIYGQAVDLNHETQLELRSVILPQLKSIQPILFSLIETMYEQERID